MNVKENRGKCREQERRRKEVICNAENKEKKKETEIRKIKETKKGRKTQRNK